MKRMLPSFLTVVALGLVMALAGCSGDDGSTGATGPTGPPGPPGASGEVTNATCLAATCHGNPTLVKTIVRIDNVVETIPLYVDNTLFTATVHGTKSCVSCHSDINASGGAHGPVEKTYGGWSRFSASSAVETIDTNEIPRTRNYITAASRSCVTCHSNHAGFQNSAHATIFKLRAAHIDAKLTAIATAEEGKPTTIGEDYKVGDCNRCHATCATCHFKSTITLKGAYPVVDKWDEIQRTDKIDNVAVPNGLSEYQMDWTKNVKSHEFRAKAYFATDAEGVCEACHTGYNRPAANAYYWINQADNVWAKVKATNVRRHPQAVELAISGSTTLSPLTGGTNTTHAQMACASCHGTAGGADGNLHNLPGLPYEWSVKGDVQCTDCHGNYQHSNTLVPMHIDNTGIKVACIGCHTFGLARDFMFASGAPVDNSADVFLDPETKEVRPVVWKNGHAIAWYSHNWQTFNAGTGKLDNTADCAKKCHYSGNLVGAGL